MRQFLGYMATIAAIPLLFYLYHSLIVEWETKTNVQTAITTSIQLDTTPSPSPVLMKDQGGEVFSEDYVEWRQPIELENIPHFFQQLLIYSEDMNFYKHDGYDVSAIVRAFLVNSANDGIQQGGSTITQQLVRMKYLSTEQTYERKVTELLYAHELEKQYEKDDILEMYLNEMYFGHLVYGVEAASTYYFNKPLPDLSDAELAFLAAIPNNPSLYDPIQNFEGTKKRQERLLDIMAREKIINSERAESYKKQPIKLKIKDKKNKYPAYSTFVLNELKDLIGEREGFTSSLSKTEDPIERDRIKAEFDKKLTDIISSGIVIETSLNSDKQSRIEKGIDSNLQRDGLQAAGVVIDNRTREIIALYGGKDYKKHDFNRAFQAVRQPGSAIKPLLIYAPLFETESYGPDSIIDGSQICIGTYCPKNYGGGVYGYVSIREAFKNSYNTAALRLFQKVGVEQAFSYLSPFRFEQLTKEDISYPSALGGFHSGVTVLEMADAYSSFIDGQYKPVRAIRSVKSKDGDVLYQWKEDKKEVWKSDTVSKIRLLMTDVVESGTGRGIQSNSTYVGAKTGTTDNYRDLWLAGLNDSYTAAVWMGYDQPRDMKKLQPLKIQHELFSILIEK